jgi:hypothetical protein
MGTTGAGAVNFGSSTTAGFLSVPEVVLVVVAGMVDDDVGVAKAKTK